MDYKNCGATLKLEDDRCWKLQASPPRLTGLPPCFPGALFPSSQAAAPAQTLQRPGRTCSGLTGAGGSTPSPAIISKIYIYTYTNITKKNFGLIHVYFLYTVFRDTYSALIRKVTCLLNYLKKSRWGILSVGRIQLAFILR